jgi:hypothetical protein
LGKTKAAGPIQTLEETVLYFTFDRLNLGDFCFPKFNIPSSTLISKSEKAYIFDSMLISNMQHACALTAFSERVVGYISGSKTVFSDPEWIRIQIG